jgi:hypothetical protein
VLLANHVGPLDIAIPFEAAEPLVHRMLAHARRARRGYQSAISPQVDVFASATCDKLPTIAARLAEPTSLLR